MRDIYFDNKKMPKPKKEYVAFIDLMGTKNHMNRSVMDASNFIFKLHAAVLSAWRKSPYMGVFAYPIMDGVYITSTNQENMEKLLVKIFSDLAEHFIAETEPQHKFIPRCGLAYGEIVHGHNVPYTASKVFEMDLSYKNNILLGKAMIDAYAGEGIAAPFGITVHESAIKHDVPNRQFGAFSINWKWCESTKIKMQDDLANRLGVALEEYFDVINEEDHKLHYKSERIAEHRRLVREYFGIEEANL